MRLDEGWNQIQFNLSDFTRRAYGTNYIETLRVQIHANCRIRRIYFSDRLYGEEELPAEFKLFLPIQVHYWPSSYVPGSSLERGVLAHNDTCALPSCPCRSKLPRPLLPPWLPVQPLLALQGAVGTRMVATHPQRPLRGLAQWMWEGGCLGRQVAGTVAIWAVPVTQTWGALAQRLQTTEVVMQAWSTAGTAA